MVLQDVMLHTVEEFEAFVMLPENVDSTFEFIGGRIVENRSRPHASMIGARISGLIGMFLISSDIGHLTGAKGGYVVSGERYIPDVGFISYVRQPALSYNDGYVANPPDLAVEVVSPGNRDDDMAIKVANYLAAGTVVWVVKPVEKQVAVFLPGEPVKVLDINASVDGGTVLPGFTLKVSDIFPE